MLVDYYQALIRTNENHRHFVLPVLSPWLGLPARVCLVSFVVRRDVLAPSMGERGPGGYLHGKPPPALSASLGGEETNLELELWSIFTFYAGISARPLPRHTTRAHVACPSLLP